MLTAYDRVLAPANNHGAPDAAVGISRASVNAASPSRRTAATRAGNRPTVAYAVGGRQISRPRLYTQRITPSSGLSATQRDAAACDARRHASRSGAGRS